MENKLQIFNHAEFGSIRTIEENGKLLFCGNDIARALGYSKPRNAVAAHCAHALKRGGVSYTTNQHGVTTAQPCEMTYIPDGDVYRLIVKAADQSKNKDIKDKAEKFERWIFDDVVPSIVNTGSYGTAPQFDAQAVAQIAAAVCAEVTKQLLVVLKPQTAPEQPTDIHELFEEELFFRSSCKLERAPAYIREPVDEMFRHMMELQRLNFSAIVRFCHKNNFKISNPAVRRYYNRVICAADDAAS